VVDHDQAVGEQPAGVRRRGPVPDRGAAVGLRLVAEVADVPAGEVERQARVGHAAQRELAPEVVEDALGEERRRPPRPLEAGDACRHVVADELRERAGAVAEEGEAGQPRLDP
jgi:hypothetical protein